MTIYSHNTQVTYLGRDNTTSAPESCETVCVQTTATTQQTNMAPSGNHRKAGHSLQTMFADALLFKQSRATRGIILPFRPSPGLPLW